LPFLQKALIGGFPKEKGEEIFAKRARGAEVCFFNGVDFFYRGMVGVGIRDATDLGGATLRIMGGGRRR